MDQDYKDGLEELRKLVEKFYRIARLYETLVLLGNLDDLIKQRRAEYDALTLKVQELLNQQQAMQPAEIES